MKHGPRKKPTALARLQNFPGKRKKRREPEPAKPDAAQLEPPAWIDEIARAEWRRLEPELTRLGLLTLLDVPAFTAFCQAYARWRKSEEQLGPLVLRKRSGLVKANPAFAAAQQAGATMLRLASHFGLTPSSRTGLVGLPLDPTQPKQKPSPAAGDEFDSFLRRSRRDRNA